MKSILALLSIFLFCFVAFIAVSIGRQSDIPSPKSLEAIMPILGASTDVTNSTSNATPPITTSITTPATTPNTLDTAIIYGLINAYRSENKQSALKIHAALELSAQKKLQDMLQKEYYDHEDALGTQSWYLFNASGYRFVHAGENLSFGYNTPWQVVEAWMRSAVHNEQLLKAEYAEMGIAADCENYIIANKPNCVVVLHLGSR